MEDLNSIHALAYFNLLKTGSWIEEKVKVAIKPYNLTHAQFNILHLLQMNDPKPVSASDLKEKLLVGNPDVTRLLDRLVKKEYVHRETCPENRRKIDISLAPSGRKIFEKAQESLKKHLGNFFMNQITAQEAKELRRILHKIRK